MGGGRWAAAAANTSQRKEPASSQDQLVQKKNKTMMKKNKNKRKNQTNNEETADLVELALASSGHRGNEEVQMPLFTNLLRILVPALRVPHLALRIVVGAHTPAA